MIDTQWMTAEGGLTGRTGSEHGLRQSVGQAQRAPVGSF
jgi:hypothetical protein